MTENTATLMPDRGESERCCCRRASKWTLGPELAVLLPREDALVAQSRGDCRIRNPSKWIRVHPETSLIVLLRRPSSLCCAGFAGTPRCALLEHHGVWRGGEKPPNSLNSRIFYALSILSCGSSVSTAGPGSNDRNSASPKRSCTPTGIPGSRTGRAPAVRGAHVASEKYFSLEPGRAALEVPPSDANLRSRCRLLDGFVGRSAILVGANLSATFCGIRHAGASQCPDWAIGTLFLRARK